MTYSYKVSLTMNNVSSLVAAFSLLILSFLIYPPKPKAKIYPFRRPARKYPRSKKGKQLSQKLAQLREDYPGYTESWYWRQARRELNWPKNI